ncbi:putative xaa-Pro dipeptidase [Helianthus annuus]|nr:putative xaa-Pro dipeptidase [Helianthus annuus]
MLIKVNTVIFCSRNWCTLFSFFMIIFHQGESYFAYLFGVREPGFYGAIDVDSGKSILFAPRLPADYAVWMGEIKPLSYFEVSPPSQLVSEVSIHYFLSSRKSWYTYLICTINILQETYMVSKAYYSDEITQVLNNQYQGSGKPLLFLLHGLNTDSQNFSKPAEFEGIEKFETDLKILHPILAECRVLKSKLELAVIQYANDISSEAHVEVMRKIKPGMKEYQLESIFLHHTYFYGSCRHCSYTCICATGNNSSVLHYGHAAAPNDRTFQDGDMALLDMGAEFCFYGSDITCSYPVNGKFTSNQRLIYNAVLDAHDAVISSMKPGVNWVDMHKYVFYSSFQMNIIEQLLMKNTILNLKKHGTNFRVN